MYDVTAIGELLIDFTPAGLSLSGNEMFERNPGGAPANVLAAVKKLGKKAAFIGMVGKDQFGIFLKGVLEASGIDVSGLVFSEYVNTTLAFVHLDRKGDRSFSFYRNPGADMMIRERDLNFEVIGNTKIFHFGSVSLTHEPARSTTMEAVMCAKDNGAIISYDPNLRPPLWSSLDEAKKNILLGLEHADILKISEEELEFITGIKNPEKGTSLLHKMGIKAVFVTLGAKGCYYRYNGGTGRISTYDTKVIDTTGAGDGFFGGVLYKLSELSMDEISNLSKPDFEKIVDFGNAAGSLVTTKKGAIPAMPTLEEVTDCQRQIPKLEF